MKTRILYILFGLFFLSNSSVAQLGYYSQLYNNYNYINPAYTGEAQKIRAFIQYRKQWFTINNGYTTQSFGLDISKNKNGFGLYVLNNYANSYNLSLTQILLMYNRTVTLKTNHKLSFGIQSGVNQFKFNPTSLQFENQYNNISGFDQNLSNGESFYGQQKSFLNISSGLKYTISESKWLPVVGFSFQNMVNSKRNWLGNSTSILNPQLNISLNVTKKIKNNFSISPMVTYSKQKKSTNTNVGLLLNKELTNKTLYLYTGTRISDALVFGIGAKNEKFNVGISYDANISKLKTSTKSIGATELFLSISFKTKKKEKLTTKPDTSSLVIMDSIVEPKSADTLIQPEKKLTESISPMKNDDTTSTFKESQLPMKVTGTTNGIEHLEINHLDSNQVKKQIMILFDTDKSNLKTENKVLLNEFIDFIAHHVKYDILISGHTDSDGTSMYNMLLSQARAHEVMQYLIKKGVPIANIKTFSYGKSSPLFENTHEHNKAKNRRVEVLLIHE
ncbi:MAG: PorP/SprF family type IX secretion system membrane protein [Cytophagales bacterium]